MSAPFAARLFGPFTLLEPGGGAVTPAGRKARALLAFLLLHDGPVRRERLAALLWGDRGEEQARASLRQQLYDLRALTTGPAPLLVVERHQVRADPDRVRTDIGRMAALAVGGDAEAAVALVEEAELLSDLIDIDPDFDAWATTERARRRDERMGVAVAIAERALAAGRPRAAAALADRLLAVEPDEDAAARLAIAAHARAGDAAAAHRALARHRDALRRDFGALPSPDLAAILDREVAGAPPALPLARPASPPLVAVKRARRLPRAAALALPVLAALALVVWAHGRARATRPEILVRPLAVPAGDAAAQALAAGLSSDLARMVVGVDSRLVVVDASDPRGAKAGYVVAGAGRTEGGRLHASVRLLDPATDAILWSRSFDRAAGEANGLRDQMVAHLTDVSACAIGGGSPGLSGLGLDGMRLLLQACEEKHGDWEHCAQLLARLVEERPRFAHGWAMLAAATAAAASGLPPEEAAPQFRQARRLAAHALRLDPHDVESYFALVDTRPGLAHWPERYRLLAHANAIDSNNETITIDLSAVLTEVGRRNESVVLARRGLDLGPANQWAVVRLINDTGFYGDPDDVPALLALADRRWPGDPDVAAMRFKYEARSGDPAAAARLLDAPDRPFYQSPARLAAWRALIAGRQGRDVAAAVALFARDLKSSDPVAVYAAADDLVVLGRADLVLAALDGPDAPLLPSTENLFRDYWAPARADPRFLRVAARQGLLAIWRASGWPDFCTAPDRPYDCARTARAEGV